MSITMKRWLKGLVKSWTAHAGTYIAVLGYLQTQNDIIDDYLGPKATGIMLMVFGLVIVLLRTKTTESLVEKGSK